MHMGARGVMTLALPWRRIDADRLFLAVCLLVPSLVQGLGLIFLLGRNGLVSRAFGEVDIYGLPGLVIANGLYALPQAALIIAAALRGADARVYEAAEVLGAPAWRQFLDITLPNIKFGLLGAAFVVFTVTITDFGNAATVGGDYSLLATEIYNQVVGQMNFNLGAVVGIMLLLPTVLAFYLERVAAQRQLGVMSEAAVPGLVLSLSYIFAFNAPGMPLSFLYGTAVLIAVCNAMHYWTQGFLTTMTGLRRVPAALEETAACLGAALPRVVRDVVGPSMAPTLVSVCFFLVMQ